MRPWQFAVFIAAVSLQVSTVWAAPAAQATPSRPAARVSPDGAKSALYDNGVDWCATTAKFRQRYPEGPKDASCFEGTCDNPTNRNASIPGVSAPVTTVRIAFHIFRNDDGSNAAATQAGVDAQLAQLNSDYAPSHIQFVASTEFVDSSTYRVFSDNEEVAMKNAYADSPATQLNIYVVSVLGGYLGVGTFPWDAVSLDNLGGIIMEESAFGAGAKTLTHEVGHCLGLWHTHHGVTELSQCSVCYERADGANGDTTGDFCADTEPTPINFDCAGPGGSDACSATAWGPTDPQNYMGYAPDSCYSEFSSQQMGRMHCWSNAVLTSWMLPSGEGRVVLDRDRYNCSDAIEVTLLDEDLANDGTANVLISVTSGDSEALTLTENGALPGQFLGTLSTSDAPGADNNGTLNLNLSDVITVTYNDASNGQSVPAVSTDTALLDCVLPTISNVSVDFAAGTTARISFTTSEECNGIVRYGTSCIGTNLTETGSAALTHGISLSGLTAGTTYRFKVLAVDAGGNQAVQDNGGGCFSFTTALSYDFLTEQFVTTPDLAFKSITFTPDSSPEGYEVCTGTASALPTSMAGATTVVLDDDDFSAVTLASSRSVLLHGIAYSELFINSNGNITFGAGDTTAQASLGAHFGLPRISALFVDFDPSAGGLVQRLQTADRFVVTFTNVPEWDQADATTMQTELFFDGRIRFTYLGMQADYGITGLSQGFGSEIVTSLSNLSGYSDCSVLHPFTAPFISGAPWAELSENATLRIISEGLAGTVHYAWTRNGSPVGVDSDTYVMNPVAAQDEGTYRATVTDESKQVYQTPAFHLEVVPLGGLPAAGGVALLLLTASIAASVVSGRRRVSGKD